MRDNKKSNSKPLKPLQALVLALLILILIFLMFKLSLKSNTNDNSNKGEGYTDNYNGDQDDEELDILNEIDQIIEESKSLEHTYYYDEALAKLQDYEADYKENHEATYGPNEKLTEAISLLETKISGLKPFGSYERVENVHHVFFHSLIADTSKAFDGDEEANGYNYYMTTVSEFIEMMNQMYADGYVLVSIHDLVKPVIKEDGSLVMEVGNLRLPPDKKPFVLSQDDVNYYDYMQGDGFANKIVIDENGRPSTEMTLDDGTKSVGDYDIVPIIETFVKEHPDFSYKGARGILALTGYEGALGYRTNDPSSLTYEEDKETVKEVAKTLREWGWEFASHSWGHRDMKKYTYDFLVTDTNRWLSEVGALIGPTDIYIFPYGIDIEDTGTYDESKYQYLRDNGFLYYCGVFKEPWMQVDPNYIRMTRRPLDGQAMLQFPERLRDLFDLEKVIDPARPALK